MGYSSILWWAMCRNLRNGRFIDFKTSLETIWMAVYVCVFVCVYRLCLQQTNKQFLCQILSLSLSSSTVHVNLHVEMTAFQNITLVFNGIEGCLTGVEFDDFIHRGFLCWKMFISFFLWAVQMMPLKSYSVCIWEESFFIPSY